MNRKQERKITKTRKKTKKNKLECFSHLKCLLNICRVKVSDTKKKKNGRKSKAKGETEKICLSYLLKKKTLSGLSGTKHNETRKTN